MDLQKSFNRKKVIIKVIFYEGTFYLKVDKTEGNLSDLLIKPISGLVVARRKPIMTLMLEILFGLAFIILNGLPGGPCPPVNRRD